MPFRSQHAVHTLVVVGTPRPTDIERDPFVNHPMSDVHNWLAATSGKKTDTKKKASLDYSKFDSILDSDDEDDAGADAVRQAQAALPPQLRQNLAMAQAAAHARREGVQALDGAPPTAGKLTLIRLGMVAHARRGLAPSFSWITIERPSTLYAP